MSGIVKLHPNSRYSMEDIRRIAEDFDVVARERCGLSYNPVEFVITDHRGIVKAAARSGFPERYPFWRWGQEEERLDAPLSYGASRIYEMVRSGNPNRAYLLDFNELNTQKMVIAHVYGHVHMFKNNVLLARQDQNMADVMAQNAGFVNEFYSRYGISPVEKVLEACTSLEMLIDPYDFRKKKEHVEREDIVRKSTYYDPRKRQSQISLWHVDKDIDPSLNDEEWMKFQQEKQASIVHRIPSEPTLDVLGFIAENGQKLDRWERRIINIVREESIYFAPQWRTKILNEGFASYIHQMMMAELGLAGDEGIFDYARINAGVVQGSIASSLNPYRLGLAMLMDIRERYDKGRHGPGYERCKNAYERSHYDTKAMEGEKKVLEVASKYSDVQFIEEFLTHELMEKLMMFTTRRDPESVERISDRALDKEFVRIKKQLLMQLINAGEPMISVFDGKFREDNLYLRHEHFGFDLDRTKLEDTLKQVYVLWKRPVHLKTRMRIHDQKQSRPLLNSLELEDHKSICVRVSYDGSDAVTLENVCKNFGGTGGSECDCDQYAYDQDLRSPVPSGWRT